MPKILLLFLALLCLASTSFAEAPLFTTDDTPLQCSEPFTVEGTWDLTAFLYDHYEASPHLSYYWVCTYSSFLLKNPCGKTGSLQVLSRSQNQSGDYSPTLPCQLKVTCCFRSDLPQY